VLRLKDVARLTLSAPKAFVEALADDLNTPAAIAELSALVTAANIAKKPADHGQAKGELLAAAGCSACSMTIPSIGSAQLRRASAGDRSLWSPNGSRRARRKNYAESDRCAMSLPRAALK
jgi:cysteinyl-tRNA synthetase